MLSDSKSIIFPILLHVKILQTKTLIMQLKKLLGYGLLLLSFLCTEVAAEGTKQLAPNTNIVVNGNNTHDVAALLIDDSNYNSFASYTNSNPQSRLYIRMLNPSTESLMVGFSRGTENESSTNPTQVDFYFRIVDPAGNIVFGPFLVDGSSFQIQNHGEALVGPNLLYGANGYAALEISSQMLQSQGWSGSGDYYIEFNDPLQVNGSPEFLINFWDLTVVDNSGPTAVERPGRVWSYNWALFAINDYGFPERPFNGAFYVCAPDEQDDGSAYITKIDFNGSLFTPAAFNIAFNSFGALQTGDINVDRRSQWDANTTTPEYPIYLNDPIELCKAAEIGTIALSGIKRCEQRDICFEFEASKSGIVEFILDFDGMDGIYTPGTADVLFSFEVDSSDVNKVNCAPWDGFNGLGQDLSGTTNLTIPVVVNYRLGVYHFPIYDAERLTDGFMVTSVRPTNPVTQLHYDDTNIMVSSGSGEPNIELNGCNPPCHRWTNYTQPNTIGFGNLNTINTWWFSQEIREEYSFNLPSYIALATFGADSICQNMPWIYAVSQEVPQGNTLNIIESQWTGPGIVMEQGDSIQVDQEGSYIYAMSWVTADGDTCSIASEWVITKEVNCCSGAFDVRNITDTLPCEAADPLPLPIDSLLSRGLVVTNSFDCVTFGSKLLASQETIGGCMGEPSIFIRDYTIWDDVDEDGIQDPDETAKTTRHTIIRLAPQISVTFDPSGMLANFNNGDTLYVSCQASDTSWTPPQANLDALEVDAQCINFNATAEDILLDSNACTSSDYLSLYKCIWTINADCDFDTTLYIFMKVIDDRPPLVITEGSDITISCNTAVPPSDITYLDNCSCTHLEERFDTISYDCSKQFNMLRIVRLTDHCDNYTESLSFVHVRDTSSFEMELSSRLPAAKDGDTLIVECNAENQNLWLSVSTVDLWVSDQAECSSYNIKLNWDVQADDCPATSFVEHMNYQWLVEDDCNNKDTFELVVYFQDTIAPEIQDIQLVDCSIESDPIITTSDECTSVTVDWNLASTEVNCYGLDAQLLHVVAEDACGNQVSKDLLIPASNGDVEVDFSSNNPFLNNVKSGDSLYFACEEYPNIESIFNLHDVQVNDSCGLQAIQLSTTPLDVACSSPWNDAIRYTWHLQIPCVNGTDKFEVVVFQSKSKLTYPNAQYSLACHQFDSIVQYIPTCGMTDVTYELVHESITCFTPSEIELSWLDKCGDQQQNTVLIYKIDLAPPSISKPDNILCELEEVELFAFNDNCIPVDALTKEVTLLDSCGKLKQYQISVSDACWPAVLDSFYVLETGNLEPYEFFVYLPDFGNIVDGDEFRFSCQSPLDLTQLTGMMDCFSDIPIAYNQEVTPLNCELDAYIEEQLISVWPKTTCAPSDTLKFIVRYFDEQAPFTMRNPDDITLHCAVDDLPAVDFTVFDCTEIETTESKELISSGNQQQTWLQSWTFEDACGNVSTASREVHIDNAMQCEINYPSIINCFELTTLQSDVIGGSGEYTYRWYIESGRCNFVSSTTKDHVQVIVNGGESIVVLEVTDAQGCQSYCNVTLSCQKTYVAPIEVQQSATPTQFYHALLQTFERGEKLHCFDLLGRRLTFTFDLNGIVEFKHRSLPFGVYILSNGNASVKLIYMP